MKRSGPLTRRTPLQTRTRLERRTRVAPINRGRRARLFEQQYGKGGKYAAWIREQSCAACGSQKNLHAAHVRSRGAGGTWRDLVPLCGAQCHPYAHQHGNEALELMWEINLTEDAAMYVEKYHAENPGSGA